MQKKKENKKEMKRMDDEIKLKKFKAERLKLSKMEKYYESKKDKYYALYCSQRRKIEEVEKEISTISHKYEKRDLVVLSEGENFVIAQIQKLIGAKRYKIFEYMNSRTGTEHIITEDRIVCRVQSIPNRFELKLKEVKS